MSTPSARVRKSHSGCHYRLWLSCHSVYDDNLWQTPLANARTILSSKRISHSDCHRRLWLLSFGLRWRICGKIGNSFCHPDYEPMTCDRVRPVIQVMVHGLWRDGTTAKARDARKTPGNPLKKSPEFNKSKEKKILTVVNTPSYDVCGKPE